MIKKTDLLGVMVITPRVFEDGNAFIEAFNGKFRAECLNAHWLMTLADAWEKLGNWRRDDNEVRQHSAIGHNVPVDIHNLGGVASPLP